MKLQRKKDQVETALATIEKDPRTQAITRTASSFIGSAESLIVTDEVSLGKAVDLVGKVKTAEKDLQSIVDFFVTPLKAQVSRMERFFGEPRKRLRRAEEIVKRKLVEYQTSLEEAERARLTELNKREVRSADRKGEGESYREEIRQVARKEVGRNVTGSTGATVTFTERATVEIEDISVVPPRLLLLDESAALAEWRAVGNSVEFKIDGLRFYMRKVPTVRT